ncbi:hypothetical protein ABNQ39_00120 (plasmid) [Azospirillum sp. A26]|uniref:hypothetical protein n=1 Tax=Azospirillum sp. A26 TaxID=3160607 RepID=UPI003670A5B2
MSEEQAAPAVPEVVTSEPVSPVEAPATDAAPALTLAHVHDDLLAHYRAIEHNVEAHVLGPIWSLIERIKAEISL